MSSVAAPEEILDSAPHSVGCRFEFQNLLFRLLGVGLGVPLVQYRANFVRRVGPTLAFAARNENPGGGNAHCTGEADQFPNVRGAQRSTEFHPSTLEAWTDDCFRR